MKYIGSKRVIAKEIIPYILQNKKDSQYYVEPFVGGCNSIDHVTGLRIGADLHKELIAMWKALQNGWIPPLEITKEEYQNIKINKNSYPDYLVGYVGFNCSYKGKFFDGFANTQKIRNYMIEAYNHILEQIKYLKGVEFVHSSYLDLNIPDNSIIYCDPPYKDTQSYSTSKDFNYEQFYDWCIDKHKEGHKIYISSYDLPENLFKVVWRKKITSGLRAGQHKLVEERLYIIK